MNVGEIGPFRPPCARYLVYASIEKQRARKDHPLKNLIPKACLFPSTWLRILTVPSCCFPRGGINIREAFVLLRRNSLFSLEGLFRGGGNLGACFSVFRCFLKLGEWQLNLQGINESTIPKVLQYYSAATEHDRSWYKVTRDGNLPLPPPDACLCTLVARALQQGLGGLV